MQFSGAVGLGLLALALQASAFFALSIAVLFFLAYASATHDIACDGLYMASLDSKRQAAYAGWQGAFFNGARFFITGVVLKLAGHLEGQVGVFNAWSSVFVMLAVLVAVLATYNAKFLPGTLSTEHSALTASGVASLLKEVVIDFFRNDDMSTSTANN